MDDWHIGIRHNGDHALSALDRVFPGARIIDSRVPDNFSVALAAPNGKAARNLNLLVQGRQQLVRSRSATRVMRGLLAYLSANLFGYDESLISVRMAAIVREGTAWFAPTDITNQRDQAQPRLTKIGFQIVDEPTVLLDPATNELVVPEPQIAYDRDALNELDRDARLGSELPGIEPGRYPVAGWVLHSREGDGGRVPRAEAVAALLPVIAQPGADLQSAIEMLIALLESSPVIGFSYEDLPALIKELKQL